MVVRRILFILILAIIILNYEKSLYAILPYSSQKEEIIQEEGENKFLEKVESSIKDINMEKRLLMDKNMKIREERKRNLHPFVYSYSGFQEVKGILLVRPDFKKSPPVLLDKKLDKAKGFYGGFKLSPVAHFVILSIIVLFFVSIFFFIRPSVK